MGLGISWPLNKINVAEGTLLPRMKNDPDVDAYNIVIGNARTKVNEIRKQYMIRGVNLTLETFLREFNSDLNKNDFIQYIEKKSFNRWKERLISDHTYDNEKVVINHLKQFQDSIPFNSFTSKWAKDWDKFLEKKGNDLNTRWGKHKVVITYLNLAHDEEKVSFDDPYARFIVRTAESSWGPISLEDLQTLLEAYMDHRQNPLPFLKKKRGINQIDTRRGLTAPEVVVLRKFLFSCNSALRASDLAKLDEDLFENGHMTITPHKTERFGTAIKSVPLNDVARFLLDDEIEYVRSKQKTADKLIKIFRQYSSQYCNRVLKEIANKYGIKHNLHLHVGRYTFASIADQAGANHTSLMKLMGIIKRATLDKYVKTNPVAIAKDVEKLNLTIRIDPKTNVESSL